jgi:hypothetical protein
VACPFHNCGNFAGDIVDDAKPGMHQIGSGRAFKLTVAHVMHIIELATSSLEFPGVGAKVAPLFHLFVDHRGYHQAWVVIHA